MGCFLACFGFKKKRERRKPGSKSLCTEQNHGGYVPLDSDVTIKLETKPHSIARDSVFKENANEPLKLKIKRKVSFNLNVRAYEPIQNYEEYLSEDEEDGRANSNLPVLHYEEDSIASNIRSYPPNYRYQKCLEGYEDEEDEIKLDDNDLYYDDDVYYSDEELDDDYSSDSEDESKIQEKLPSQLNSGDTKSRNSHKPMQLHDDVSNKEFQRLESKCQTRDRNNYVHAVLNPVENLAQWKAVKANAKSQFKRLKENIVLQKEEEIPKPNFSTVPQTAVQNIAVDASLSNWLASSKAETISEKSTIR